MKHLIKFNLFEEINPRDIEIIQTDFNDYFTISFEFEIETDDRENSIYNFNEIDHETIIDISDTVIDDLDIRKKSEKKFINDLLFELLDYCETDEISIDIFNNIFNSNNIGEDDRKYLIIKHLKSTVLSYIYEEDYNYLKRMFKLNMPNFYRKWNRKLDFVGDVTLDRGIEIKPKTYLDSISNAIDILNDFYKDLENQSYWKFSERTGLHINIGVKDKKPKWNPIKGLLLLNDFSKSDKTPFVFKDMTWRMNNDFCGSLMPHIISLPKKEIDKIKKLDLHDIESVESQLNKFIKSQVDRVGFKNLGFNINKLSDNYVEFRYAGGVIPKNVMIEKVKYFCFIIYAMTNSDYKRKEYLKKLYKFIDTL
jgi:hypothetical protein